MFDQLTKKVGEIISLGYTGVLLELSNVCLRLKCKQALFFKVVIFEINYYLNLYLKVNLLIFFSRHYVKH